MGEVRCRQIQAMLEKTQLMPVNDVQTALTMTVRFTDLGDTISGPSLVFLNVFVCLREVRTVVVFAGEDGHLHDCAHSQISSRDMSGRRA